MTEWIRTGPRTPGPPRSQGGPACSVGSRARDESMTATASPGRRWLLVEVAGAWGWNVWTESPVLPAEVGTALARRAQAAGMRIAAIRRPGRSRGHGRWRWAIVDTDEPTPRVHWGEVSAPEELLTVPLDGRAGAVTDAPLFVVCAHGRHDECCAVRGRTVAASLAQAFPDETWECSHIGGDRFAATMVLFPHGLQYGRVDELDAVAIAEEFFAGRIAEAGFRGRTTWSHVEQAAVAAVVARTGNHRIDAVRPVDVTEPIAEGDAWTVVLETDDVVHEVELDRVLTGPLFTTCRATVAVEVPRYSVRNVVTRARTVR